MTLQSGYARVGRAVEAVGQALQQRLLVAPLQPGSYSVQVSATAGAGGLVIAEVYEVP